MFLKLKSFWMEESGASLVEYGVALLVVIAVGVTAMTNLGDATEDNVAAACSNLQESADGSCVVG